MPPRLSLVVPHWPLDEEVRESLHACLASLPADCEKVVVVNAGTGFARNVNLGLGLATGEYVGVVTNDSRVLEGDVYDLCVPGTVASPIVLEKPGVEPGGFHGAFWVAPREVLDRVGLLDERFAGAFYEDDDFLARLRREGVPTVQVPSVRAWSRRIGLTMSKLPDKGQGWLRANAARFEEKWGWLPPPTDPGARLDPDRRGRYGARVSARPVIGITTYAQDATWGVWQMPAALIPLDYVDAVERAGGRPVLIPPSADGVEETLDVLDGIVFSGGADVDPTMYGADAHPETDSPQAKRDAGELALLKAALERDVPTLAICRGVQLLNVARGGDLVQHLPETVGHDEHKVVPGSFTDHSVEVKEGSRLAEIVRARADVASHHHQGLGKLGDGLVETAWAHDGTLEGVEDPSLRFAVGVQWHPEMGEDGALFEALVEEARAYHAQRSR